MNRNKAKKWVQENHLTLAEAKELVQKSPESGMSKVNKSFTKSQALDIFLKGIDELMESHGPDKDLCSSSLGHELMARNIVRECM